MAEMYLFGAMFGIGVAFYLIVLRESGGTKRISTKEQMKILDQMIKEGR